MKCATPGKYGRKIPIESSTIRDDFIDQKVFNDVDHNLTSEEIAKDLQEHWEQLCKDRKRLFISLGRSSGKTKLREQMFEEFKEQLIKKDKEENDK